MTRNPQGPVEPNRLPDDAYHDHYGNPTASHPDVTPLYRSQFQDESLATMFVQLANQRTIGQDSTEYAGDSSGPYTVVATSLPVIRPLDINRGLLIYQPEPNPQAVYEIREKPETTDDTSPEEIGVTVFETETPLNDATPDTLKSTTRSATVTVRQLCDEFTFLIQSVSLLPNSDLRS